MSRPSDPKPSSGTRAAGSIIAPGVDLLCVGLGSILLFAPFVLADVDWILRHDPDTLLQLTILLNMPHFLASYRIVYSSRDYVRRYKWASMYVPAGLMAYGLLAVVMAESTTLFVDVMLVISQVYLAWHYTGQVWGMMATFAQLSGEGYSSRERLLIRGGLRLLLGWHVTWCFHYTQEFSSFQEARTLAYSLMSLLSIVSVGLVIAGLVLHARRTGRAPALRSVVAWLAVCFWYAAMAKDPGVFLWVQMAHAVQYLIFPARVEMNRHDRKHAGRPGRRLMHLIVYGGALILGGFLFEVLAYEVGARFFDLVVGDSARTAFLTVSLAFLNIHHYFTDGCIWKISSPTVREDLFAHLKRTDSGGTS